MLARAGVGSGMACFSLHVNAIVSASRCPERTLCIQRERERHMRNRMQLESIFLWRSSGVPSAVDTTLTYTLDIVDVLGAR